MEAVTNSELARLSRDLESLNAKLLWERTGAGLACRAHHLALPGYASAAHAFWSIRTIARVSFWVKPMSRVTACVGGHPPIGGTFASVMTFLHFATSAFT